MERFLIGAALAFAAIVAVGAVIGPESFHINIGDDDEKAGVETPLPVTAEGAALQQTPYPATELVIENAVARVTLIPEARSDILVAVEGGSRLPALGARLDGARLILDGGLGGRVRSCSWSDGGGGEGRDEVEIRGIGDVALGDMPHVTVRTPRAVRYHVNGAVYSAIGASETAELSFNGCGRSEVEAVDGALTLAAAGSGDVKATTARSAQLSIAGSADVEIGAVPERATLSVAGSGDADLGQIGQGLVVQLAGAGDVDVASVDGPLDVSIAGSGDVRVRGGTPGAVKASITGSGALAVDVPVETLDASIMGSGDVSVASVKGSVNQTTLGSGDVIIGGR